MLNNQIDREPNLKIYAITVAAFALIAILIFILNFHDQNFSQKIEHWGQFGDFMGGVINPAIGLATVVLIIQTIKFQRKELQASIKELRSANDSSFKTSFEQTLFSWLGNYRELVNQISASEKIGRQALVSIYETHISANSVIQAHDDNMDPLSTEIYRQHFLDKDGQYIPGLIDERHLAEAVVTAESIYSQVYAMHRSELDAMFRTIFRLFKWIDDTQRLTPEEKWHYCALVRAQLSWCELAFLYYNCKVPNGSRLAPLANKYALFDNLDDDGDILIAFDKLDIKCGKKQNCLLNTSALVSDDAKRNLGIPINA